MHMLYQISLLILSLLPFITSNGQSLCIKKGKYKLHGYRF